MEIPTKVCTDKALLRKEDGISLGDEQNNVRLTQYQMTMQVKDPWLEQ